MVYLILSIISSTAIFIIFKYLDKLNIPVFPVIVINYFFAALTGFLIIENKKIFGNILDNKWLLISAIIGVLFIVMFYIIGRSSQKAGIGVTTVASKMSVMIPITFSIIIDPFDNLNLLKLTGILLALLAVAMTVYKKRIQLQDRSAIYLPILLFAGMGIVDSLVKYAQLHYVDNREIISFTIILFIISFISGIIGLIFRKDKFQGLLMRKNILWGLMLGLVNFGSIYFLLRTLNFEKNGNSIDSSVVFGVNNTGIVMVSVIAGMVIFGEKPGAINKAGMILSIIAIIIFSLA